MKPGTSYTQRMRGKDLRRKLPENIGKLRLRGKDLRRKLPENIGKLRLRGGGLHWKLPKNIGKDLRRMTLIKQSTGRRSLKSMTWKS